MEMIGFIGWKRKRKQCVLIVKEIRMRIIYSENYWI